MAPQSVDGIRRSDAKEQVYGEADGEDGSRGGQGVASAARAASVKRFVFTSTGLVYDSNGVAWRARMIPARRRRPTR
jgi:nucleoside-diphosphate-sugar epimerase